MLWKILIFTGAVLLCPPVVFSQTTFASITGRVVDPSGAAIPDATITVVNVETGVRNTARSNDSGNYTISSLIEGKYTVKGSASGFSDFEMTDVILAARDIRRVDVRFELGGVQATVQVSGGSTLIETETARISDTMSAAVLKDMPVNTRGAQRFLVLAPNVQRQPGSFDYMFAGSHDNQEKFTIDGNSISDLASGQPHSPFFNYIESFEEVKLDISNNSAEFGPIGNVTFITKSGTNTFHGNVFDYYSTPWFRARNPFALVRGIGIIHNPGGSAGGPVYLPHVYDGRNKTFFFFSYETSRGSATNQLLNPTVPLAAWRTGDFSGMGQPITDPTNGQPFPGNTIPAGRINAVSKALQDRFYPLPNFGNPNALSSQNYRELKVRSYDPSTFGVVRIDQHFNDRDSVFGRVSLSSLHNSPWQGNLPTIGQFNNRRVDQSATVSETHIVRPTLINEFRWGFYLNNNPIQGPVNGLSETKDLGLVGLSPDLPNISGMLKVGWTGLGLQRLAQSDYSNPGFRNHAEEFQDHMSWFRGRHSVKFGFELTRAEWDDYQANANLFGSVTFTNRFTGFPYADFLLGIPTSAARAFAPLAVDRNRWQYDFFAADDFKVSPRLTVNFGLRYELHMPWRENNHLTSTFDVGSGKLVVEDGALAKVSPIFPKSYVSVVEAGSLGLPGHTLMFADRNNFAPRFGLAYRPFSAKTVFRAGYGIYYDVVPATLSQGGSPFVLNEPTYTNPVQAPDVIFPRVFPAASTGGPSQVSLPLAVNPHLRMPYSMQYNATIEHQVGAIGLRVSYIGTASRQGLWAYNYNSPVPDTRPFIQKARPFLSFPEIFYLTNGAGHQYNGLTLDARRQMSRGLYFETSWAWARDRYDSDSNGDVNFSELASENPFDRHREVGVFQGVPTHRFNANWIYQLPFGEGQHWLSGTSRTLNLVVGGWQLSGVYTAATGEFLTPYWTGPDPTGIAFTGSSTAAIVTRRPDELRDPNLPSSGRSVTHWFDVSAFRAPQPGQFGSAAKGVIKGPGANVLMAGLYKTFVFSEHAPRLRFQVTATNLLNHPNWGDPASTNISDGTNAGAIQSVAPNSGLDGGAARSFLVGLRLEW
jgi:hypothetical protein